MFDSEIKINYITKNNISSYIEKIEIFKYTYGSVIDSILLVTDSNFKKSKTAYDTLLQKHPAFKDKVIYYKDIPYMKCRELLNFLCLIEGRQTIIRLNRYSEVMIIYLDGEIFDNEIVVQSLRLQCELERVSEKRQATIESFSFPKRVRTSENDSQSWASLIQEYGLENSSEVRKRCGQLHATIPSRKDVVKLLTEPSPLGQ